MAEVFYTPGLGGEDTIQRQKKFIDFLNNHRRRQVFFFDPRWQSSENKDEKLDRLNYAYDVAGRPQKLFGVSAGATMAVILGDAFKDTEIITIAGKHKGSATIGPDYQRRAPALLPFVEMSEAILSRDLELQRRMTSYHPWLIDGVVPMEDIIVPGASNKTIWVPKHSLAIAAALTTVLPRIG